MKYELYVTRSAEADIEESVDYIEFVLKNPQTADSLLDAVNEAFQSLTAFPLRNSLASDPLLNAWGIRFVIIKNHLAFYTVDEAVGRVNVIRFLYMKRDWVNILQNGSFRE